MLWLGGGPATIDMWDLKPDAPAEIRGEFKPIDTNVPGMQICEHLPKMAQVCDKVTLVRSLNHTIPVARPRPRSSCRPATSRRRPCSTPSSAR